MDNWVGVIAVLVAFMALFPEEGDEFLQTMELGLKRFWLHLYYWPQMELAKLRLKFTLWKIRKNRINRKKL